MNTVRFGERMRTLRQERGWSLREASGKLGMTSPSYLGDLEAGKFLPSEDYVVRLTKLYGVARRRMDDWLVSDRLTALTGEKGPGVSFFMRSLGDLDERAQRQAIKTLLGRLQKRQERGEPWPDEYAIRKETS